MSANLAERHQIKKMVDEIEKRKPGFPTLVKDITQQKLEKYDPIQIQDDLHNLQAARKRVAHLRSELKLLMSEVEQFNKQFSPSPKIDALIRKPENRELVFETNPLSPRQMFDKLPGVFGTKQQQQQQQQPQKSEDPQEMIDTTLDLLRSLTRDELTLKKLIETNATQKMMNLEFIVEESVNLLNVSFPSFKKYLRDHGGNFVLDLDKEDADEEIWDFFLDIDDLVKNMKQHHPKQQRESVTVLTQTVKFLSELSTHPEGCKMLMSEDYLRCLGSMLFVQNDEIKTAARVACENVVAAIWAEEKVKLWKHSGSAFLAGGRGDMSRRESDWMKGWFAPAPPAVAAVAAVEATAAADLEDLQATREETLRFASMLMMMIQVTDDRMLPSRFYDALLNEIRMGKEINDFFTYAPFFALTGWLYGYKQIATSLMNRGEHFASGALTKSATPQQRAILRVVSRRSAFGVLALCIGSIISDDLNERRRMFVGWTPDWKFEKTFAEQKAIFLRNEVLLHTVDNVGLFAICSVAPAAFIAMLLAQIGWTVMPEDFFSGSLFRGCLREIDQVKGDIEEESEDEKD
ncbi:hypothetical protein ScalyP_jg12027 [Parmales sp. scaly parma]|nr:hypothetical protein ScalyP_jg12027 [Parmales sp. scaly parma]